MRKSLLILLLLVGNLLKAKEVNLNILNLDNNPLSSVRVTNLKTQKTHYSNTKGVVIVDGDEIDTLIISKEGYSTTELTLGNVDNLRNRVVLFPQLYVDLSEVVVRPINIYEIYKKSICNLKNRLVKGRKRSYSCVGNETELNQGSYRGIQFRFTSELKRVNSDRLKYSYWLSDIKHIEENVISEIMRGNKFRLNLFVNDISIQLKDSEKNQIQITDTTFIIYDNSSNSYRAVYTINRADTTLIEEKYEYIKPNKDYTRRRTFRAKDLNYLAIIQYTEDEDGYYLAKYKFDWETSFLVGRPRKDERIYCSYELRAIPIELPNALKEFIPNTEYLFDISNSY